MPFTFQIEHFKASDKYNILHHVLLLVIIGVLVIVSVYNGDQEYKYEYGLFYESIGYFLLFTGVIYLNRYILVPHFLLKERLGSYFSAVIGCIIATLLVVVIIQTTLFYPHDIKGEAELLINIIGTGIGVGMIIVSTSILPLFQRWKENNRHINQLESATMETELQQLKNQINPHFLFNTINSANIKIGKNPEFAFHIISRLEELLRYQLTDSSRDEIYLKDDIAFLSNYLDLEKIRRKDFSYTLTIDESISEIKLPPLLFIPFVENAVKHSATTKEQSYICIEFQNKEGFLHFYCQNSKPETPAVNKVGGIGLNNIQRRLQLLYGSDHLLEISSTEKTYTVNLYLKI